MTGLRRIINVRPEERALTAVLFLQYFFVVAVAISGNSARDALFLNRYDRSLLPLMLAACAIAVAAAAAVYSRLARRLSPKTLQNTVNLLLLLGLLLLKFRLEGHGIPVLYVWIEMTVAIVTLSFWLAASEVFDPRQAKRLFGPIGGGGALACILVGSAVDPFSKAFGAESLLWLAALGLAAQWALGTWGVRHVFEPRPAALRPRPQAAGPRFDAYLVSIAAVVALSAVVSQLVDFQFKMFAAEAISSESDLAGFFGRFYAVTGGATLLVQFFLTSTVLTRFGLLAGMLTLPLSLGSSALLVLLQPALFSAGIGKFADQTFKFTLNSSSWELLWLPVPLARRKTIRPLVSGSVKAVAEASAGLVTFFLVGYTGLRYLSLVSLGALAAWIVTAVRLKRLYAKALIFALERRQVDFEGLTLDAQDPAFVRVVERTLESSDEAERLFALELMDGLPLAQWSAALRRCFDEGSPEVRLKVMQLVANEPEVFSEDSILEAVRAEGPVALEAIRAVAARGLTGADPVLRELIGSGPPEVRAAAAAVFLERNTADRELAAGAMKQLLENADRRGQAAALPHLADHPELLPASLLAACLRDPSRPVQEAALKVAALRKEVSVMAEVVACLDDPRNTPYVLEAVRSVPADRAIPHLERSLRAGDTPPATKLGILRILAVFPAGAAAPLLVQTISPDDLELSAQAVRSLLALARNQQIPAECVSGVPKVTDAMLRSTYQLNRMLKLLGSSPVDTVLQSDLADRIRQIVPIVLGLEMISSHNSSLEDAVTIAEDDDPVRLPLLLELLDQVLPPEKRKSIMPLIEALSVDERDSAGIRLYSDLPSQLDRELSKRVYSPREWEAAIVIDHLWRADYAGLLKSVDWGRVQDSRLTREVKAAVANQLKGMYSTLEKAILLKGVSLFADIPMEKLGKIAQFAQETRLPKGSVVVREGEFGDSLFIVADGAVRVHKGSQNLAVLRKGDCVGEMALLDYSPRSADVTVEEDAALFRIEREDFHEVTTTNPEIMQAIVRMLVRRLREADEKLARQPGGTE